MSGRQPRVTIVIPFYNDPYVGEAVDSALAQTYPDVEVIVVSDGATREVERLAPYAGRVQLLRKPNGGTASALNCGFRRASGEYVAWLSSDDRFEREKAERQVRFMEATGAWISHTAFRYMNEKGELEGQAVRLKHATPYQFYDSFRRNNAINGCTVMMRRELFERIGGFDERLPYTHDYDFWLRCLLAGYPIAYMREPLTVYRRHPAMGTIRHRHKIEQEFQAVSGRYLDRLNGLLAALKPPRAAVSRREEANR